jgi:hypothetical protein
MELQGLVLCLFGSTIMKAIFPAILALSFMAQPVVAQKCGPVEQPRLISYNEQDVSDELNGSVRTMRRYKIWNIGASKPDLEEEIKFNRAGKEISSKHPNELPAGPDEDFRVEQECDGPRLTGEKLFKQDGSPHASTKYKYDTAGRIIEVSESFGDGTLNIRDVYTRDEKGNIVKEVETKQVHPEHFRPKRYDVYVTTSSTYRYDEKNRLIEEKGFYPNGSIAYTWSYEYDDANRRARKYWADAKNRPIDLEINKYSSSGQLAEKWKYQNFCYTKSPSSEDPGELCPGKLNTDFGVFYYGTKTVYTYDSHKNWIEQVDLEISEKEGKKAFKPSTSESRRIIYY